MIRRLHELHAANSSRFVITYSKSSIVFKKQTKNSILRLSFSYFYGKKSTFFNELYINYINGLTCHTSVYGCNYCCIDDVRWTWLSLLICRYVRRIVRLSWRVGIIRVRICWRMWIIERLRVILRIHCRRALHRCRYICCRRGLRHRLRVRGWCCIVHCSNIWFMHHG